MNQIQEWMHELKQIDLEHLQHTLESYSAYGPLPGILLPLVEAFMPILPLLVFVAANANIYGLWLGSLYSWIGVSAGSMLLFWVARKLGGRVGSWLRRRFPKASGVLNWIDHKGFSPIFLFACFPFSPSALITVVSGLSNVPFRSFALAVLLGKAVMIFSISLLSFNISDLAKEPWRLLLTAVLIVAMWFGGKKLEARYQVK
ncbi:putative membrane protein YhjE [Paenibacillus baekrokdamisoli]|uniref:TVP38/TMEM64 family membrane protein n=1 Tax=Paenibacillus baekrokdamisoli TaxID=1712516 RepID=A0A3G9JCT1_9BACL|nr:TVP38/TMEM64 family protein [Paenibacillus baekrokdamisoli]MBB3068204.1 putative membrane protein YdjX (TVP38/TMEM64 family) [Paenibacillus baekrokdamisoli]BBH22753.1 putative membrane protein YhjE [Paenibacillus baekrokdamisoli]